MVLDTWVVISKTTSVETDEMDRVAGVPARPLTEVTMPSRCGASVFALPRVSAYTCTGHGDDLIRIRDVLEFQLYRTTGSACLTRAEQTQILTSGPLLCLACLFFE
jgi:hypothetical protein